MRKIDYAKNSPQNPNDVKNELPKVVDVKKAAPKIVRAKKNLIKKVIVSSYRFRKTSTKKKSLKRKNHELQLQIIETTK